MDAVLACFDAVPLARTSVLLGEARGILGRVLRDPEPLRRQMDATELDPAVRRAAVVGLALLGEEVALEEAVPDAGDADDAAAYIIAAIAAAGAGAYDLLVLADRRSLGAGRAVTDDALRRFDGGDYVCVAG